VVIAYVRGPGHSLELIEYRGPGGRAAVRPRPCDTGFAHVAFNVLDVDAALAAVKPHGVEPIAPPVAIDQGPNTGRRVVYTRDPDGICIEFIEVAT
jgi:catechol 2,3-dioxygenase-like lactoylglutathione lyase family enzyme